MSARSPLIAASVFALSLLAGATSASAACKTMGFTVNDYGKDGPTKDAKDLLDKEIAKWAADNGVEKYTVGKKTVKCELFLDVILFDEHTCTASASVCWGEGASAPPKTAKEGSAKKSSTKAADTEEKPPVETGAITQESKPEPAAEAKTEAPAAAAPEVEAPPLAPAATQQNDAAERAAAAAERAAAAAERAAAAAEKAAAGNREEKSASSETDAARQIAPAAEPATP